MRELEHHASDATELEHVDVVMGAHTIALLLLPPLGIALVLGAAVLVYQVHSKSPAEAAIGRMQLSVWPSRPRFRSQAGAFALCGTWLSMVGVQPILLEALGMWEHSTATSLMPFIGLGLATNLLLVRPSDRSETTLFMMCFSVFLVILACGLIAVISAVSVDSCDDLLTRHFLDTTLCLGAAWGSSLLFIFALWTLWVYFTHANLSSCSRGDDGYSGAARGGRAEAGVVQMHVVLRSMWKIVRSVLTLTGVTFLFFAVARILVQVIDPKEHVAKVQTLKERIWYLGDPIDGAFLSRPRTHAPTPLVGLGLVPLPYASSPTSPTPPPSYPSSLLPLPLFPLPLFLLPLFLLPLPSYPSPSYPSLVYPFPSSPPPTISRHHLEVDLLSAPDLSDLRDLSLTRSLLARCFRAHQSSSAWFTSR